MRRIPEVELEAVRRLWFHRQGLGFSRGSRPLTKKSFVDHLECTGALQLDPLNVVDRAHYLTLWSRFGAYDRRKIDRWIYGDRIAYEYWGHEASVLPLSHLPLGRRRMRRFPGSWKSKSWWQHFQTSIASRRRVLQRIRAEGPLESGDFEKRPDEFGREGPRGGTMPLAKEDGRSLKLLWHAGKLAVSRRKHSRPAYDLHERVYPPGEPASAREYEDSWLLTGLSGNGIASEKHLTGYITGPAPSAPERRRVIERNRKAGRIVEVRVKDRRGAFYALPRHLEKLARLPAPEGTNLLCPFDSFLWQRRRAEELLGFEYRIEIYVPAAKRKYGYYVLPILHDGKLVGRLDPKMHRDEGVLEVKQVHFEPGFRKTARFRRELSSALGDLATFLGASDVRRPRI